MEQQWSCVFFRRARARVHVLTVIRPSPPLSLGFHSEVVENRKVGETLNSSKKSPRGVHPPCVHKLFVYVSLLLFSYYVGDIKDHCITFIRNLNYNGADFQAQTQLHVFNTHPSDYSEFWWLPSTATNQAYSRVDLCPPLGISLKFGIWSSEPPHPAPPAHTGLLQETSTMHEVSLLGRSVSSPPLGSQPTSRRRRGGNKCPVASGVSKKICITKTP